MESDLIEKLQKFDLSTKEDNGVTLSNDDISPGIQECSRSLIGKIHGIKRANFNGLKETLCNIWRTQQPFSIRLVGYNLFQFVFQSEEDKNKIFLGKTWSFDGQYIILKEWSTNSINWEEEAKVDLWVQIHGLPLHWITEDTGLKIGKLFANVKDVFVPDFCSITVAGLAVRRGLVAAPGGAHRGRSSCSQRLCSGPGSLGRRSGGSGSLWIDLWG
ncbi:Unknown protein [Striga hermonthica]|uniref:DUF4283 domain-containing protein n=1 Tax=Striga hermonthica TaxID=68872 RepID=A0A9N7NB03_STRHE|nr:Unknown protein [Striga hermonthica]